MSSTIPPIKGPEALSTLPVKRFERRRAIILVGGIALTCIVAYFIIQGFSHPMSGTSNLIPVKASATSTKYAQAVTTSAPVVVVAPPISTVAPTATPRKVTISGAVTSNLSAATCWANIDVSVGDGTTIPSGAMVRVSGTTGAHGGLIEVDGVWLPVNKFICDGDLTALEKPYRETSTTKKPVQPGAAPVAAKPVQPFVDYGYPTVIAGQPIVLHPSTPTPAATATPIPTPNGFYRDVNGCIVVTMNGVKEIWINSKGVSTGVYCDVRELRVVVGN